ncbi:MAG: pantoate--beta-alanine ligase [Marinifilaceae bacterium]|nr:pantoate--beta-alanine ligase [Marinifilaceae bacterium]
MQVFETKDRLSIYIKQCKERGEVVGFVPTMGALHEGHISLVKQAKESCNVVVVSIFVNPTQFNDPKDLERYPRTLENDIKLLESVGCDAVLTPSVEEIYPEPDTRQFDFGYIGEIMEGPKRPGHFNGVAQVVSRLFDIVNPDRAFFGMKDFQQIAIIRSMVSQLDYNIDIVSCPIVRESDGLAMSSRNRLLSAEHRATAPNIHRILSEAVKIHNTMSVAELKNWIIESINSNPLLEVEYVEIVDEKSLKITEEWSEEGSKVICITVYAGEIRLIDNIII